MSLKDHVTDSAKLSEEIIESIINGLIKYDPKNKSVHLLPKTNEFSAEKKIILFLVAIRGWGFITTDKVPSEASPAEISKNIGVRGGTVRRTLRELTQAQILIGRKGRYEMPAHNLSQAKELIYKSGSIGIKKSATSNKSVKPSKGQSKTRGTKSKPRLGEKFNELLSMKWFKGGKTISDLKEKLDEMTVFPPMVQLPAHLLKAYRSDQLTRKKENVDGKNVWVYYQ